MTDHVQALGAELGRFIAGEADTEQLKTAFRAYVSQHPGERDAVAAWVDARVRNGRLPADIGKELAAAIDAAHASSTTVVTQEGREKPAFDATALRPGSVIRDRFILVEELGRGGMGQVFKVRDLRREEAQDRNPFMALKVLNAEFSAHPDSFIALQREARRASMLAHPNVVTVYDFDRDGPRIFMTMEFLEGRPLDKYLTSECANGSAFATAWPIIRGIGDALAYGHRKRIIHSDLKPGNIFICNDGTVKVLDFGISRLMRPVGGAGDETVFDAGQRIGGLTPAYASLEMWNSEPPDPRDDIYAFACVIYELLSGQHPFGRASAKRAFESELSPARIGSLKRSQWEALKKGLALRRERRTPSVNELLKAFEPPSRLRKYALPVALAATVVAAVAITVSAQWYRKEILVCSDVPRPAAGRAARPPGFQLSAQQIQEIDSVLDLAADDVTKATPTMDLEELKSLLSEGTNTVNDFVEIALRIDPREPRALEIKQKIADTYAARTRELLRQRNFAAARDLVRTARRVQPESEDLFTLERDVCRASSTPQN
ncbi:MAG TPA: serine/threonine-protein kinase [Steroidobacteraceae bacterium]|nr:serine/threonine-protein kinase [Steroidobacteraceae bacterium]